MLSASRIEIQVSNCSTSAVTVANLDQINGLLDCRAYTRHVCCQVKQSYIFVTKSVLEVSPFHKAVLSQTQKQAILECVLLFVVADDGTC